MDLPTMRARLRRDLHDENDTSYRWSDDELDRHIQRALDEVSVACPRELKATLATSAGSRELSVVSLSDTILVKAVEYPDGMYPPSYVRFSVWGDVLTLLVDSEPSEGQDVLIYYEAMHVLDATSSTLPTHLEDLVATGAGAYAALEWSSFAINRINVTSEDVWRQYLLWGQDRLAAFLRRLTQLGSNGTLQSRTLYAPARLRASQASDIGP